MNRYQSGSSGEEVLVGILPHCHSSLPSEHSRKPLQTLEEGRHSPSGQRWPRHESTRVARLFSAASKS